MTILRLSEKAGVKPNVLICGKTGAGKTSLVQAVTQSGVVPDDAIGHASATTRGFALYPTDIANFIDCEGMESGQTVDEYLSFITGELVRRLDDGKEDKLIHCIWYCIDASGARVQDTDLKIIEQFKDKAILVVTKFDKLEKRKEQIKEMEKSIEGILPPDRVVMVSSKIKVGLPRLINATEKLALESMGGGVEEMKEFQKQWEMYYSDSRKRWKRRADEEADSYILWAAGRSAAIAILPIPLADIAPLIANEVYMIYRIGGAYGYSVDETVVTMIMGVAGGSIVGKIAASFVPGFKIAIAAGITYGVGKAAKAYFESDKKLSRDDIKRRFLEAKREGEKKNWDAQDKIVCEVCGTSIDVTEGMCMECGWEVPEAMIDEYRSR